MFLRRVSVHGRRMGDVRSAQQKCVRRGMLKPLILLHLEHLLSTPDMSRAALKRLQIIAAEDIGIGSPDLVPRLVELERGWSLLARQERARRLIQAAHLAVDRPASRFIPHWAVTLLKRVEIPQRGEAWRSLDELLEALQLSVRAKTWQESGLLVEEIFLRHPIAGEARLPDGIDFPADVMKVVWALIKAEARDSDKLRLESWHRCFGSPSKESVASRLFLYLALLSVHIEEDKEYTGLVIPEVSDHDVETWIDVAEQTPFLIPDWMMDQHTVSGRKAGKGLLDFFENASALAHQSARLPLSLEHSVRALSKEIYLEEEARYGRRGRSVHMRERWREQVRRTHRKTSTWEHCA